MPPVSRYRKKQILFLSVIFALFASIIIFLVYYHENKYRTNILNKELEGYSDLINNYINTYLPDKTSFIPELDSLIRIFPNDNIRTSIIDLSGKVIYDSEVKNTAGMENHISRPEIQQALTELTGFDIRISATTGIKYYYFAKRFEDYFIRIPLVYNIETRQELLSEKEKLIRHLNLLDEGIAIFSKNKEVITSNSHFVQYINYISDNLVYSAEDFFTISEFYPLFGFINVNMDADSSELTNQPSWEVTIYKNGKYFTARCVVFQDKSFEITILDSTKPAKRKLLKQQMTENIAHELKTPVSSIKGLLETVLDNKLDKTRLMDFINRAYSQTCRLTELIDDISLLTKIEEAGNLYPIEKVNLKNVIKNVIEDLHSKIEKQQIHIELNIPENIELNGNPVLLYSIFRNLFENTLNYAGEQITVRIDKYMEDPQNYYFSFSDTGTGVPDHHIPRLFERFYRVETGRDRKSGGTGLGLSIVKNAILFHRGEISVKNRKGGGLEFLFSISRNLG